MVAENALLSAILTESKEKCDLPKRILMNADANNNKQAGTEILGETNGVIQISLSAIYLTSCSNFAINN